MNNFSEKGINCCHCLFSEECQSYGAVKSGEEMKTRCGYLAQMDTGREIGVASTCGFKEGGWSINQPPLIRSTLNFKI